MIKKYSKEFLEILELFFTIYTPVIGITWICAVIYLRVFLKRNTYSLIEIKQTLTVYFLIICIIFIIIQIIILCVTILSLYRQHFQKKSSPLITELSEKFYFFFNLIYWQPLEFIYQKIAPNIPGSGKLFIYLENKWTKKQYDVFFFRSLIFFFDLLPKILLALIFLIEIVILNQLKIFPYCIGLFLIPISFNIFIKLLLTFSINNMIVLKQYFSKIEGVGEPSVYDEEGSPIAYPEYSFFIKPEYEPVVTQDDLELVLNLYSLQRYAINLKQDIKKISPYLTVITSLIYVIGGTYRLLFILS